MNKMRFNHERFNKDLKRAFTLLTVITNCFIISGVIHHWRPRDHNNTGTDAWNNTYRYTGTHEVPHPHTIRSRLYHGHGQGRL